MTQFRHVPSFLLAAAALLLLALSACAPPDRKPATDPQEVTTTSVPTTPSATTTPDSCVGWWCTLTGIVYAGAAAPGREMQGVPVELSQISWCSPVGEGQRAISGPDGAVAFRVFLHDTDTFRFQAELDGYSLARQSLGGFDCLYCKCPPLEIVLQPIAPGPADRPEPEPASPVVSVDTPVRSTDGTEVVYLPRGKGLAPIPRLPVPQQPNLPAPYDPRHCVAAHGVVGWIHSLSLNGQQHRYLGTEGMQ